MFSWSDRFHRLVLLGAALAALAGTPALAQIGGMPGNGGMGVGRPNAQSGAASKPAIPEPDAVPGAKARQPVAPATRAPADLAPTDALFDSINRGDILAARDAISRGADLDSTNVLGMTPMELSVDLGRNDISFLLLSLRGEDSGRGARALGRSDAAQAAPPAQPVVKRAARARTAKPATPVHAAAARGTGIHVAEGKPTPTPKLFANDGGTPMPNAGFLGFGSQSSE